MDTPTPVYVLGAGVVGLSTALYLQRAGLKVTIIDALPPAAGASFGNAGCVNFQGVVPPSLPGMLLKVPSWLANPMGPLAIDPKYFLFALPWLLRWIGAGRLTRVMEVSDAMAALHRGTIDCWRHLLGFSFDGLLQQTGMIQVWETEKVDCNFRLETMLRRRAGIDIQELGPADIQDQYPGISRAVRRGILIPTTFQAASPGRLVLTLAKIFVAQGGTILHEKVMKIVPRNGESYQLLTNVANYAATCIVIAAGAWSSELLAPLGIKVPFETERGYHAQMARSSINVRVPLVNNSRGFAVTQFEDGLRIVGTVEIAGLRTPPNEKRAEILLDQAKLMFPTLECDEPRLWMGFRPSTPDGLPNSRSSFE
jgi:glycine/D-amino acid oxidase-like deaminating enzyme